MKTFHISLRRVAVAATAAALATGSLAGAASAETANFADSRTDFDHGADVHRVRVVNEDRVKVRSSSSSVARSRARTTPCCRR